MPDMLIGVVTGFLTAFLLAFFVVTIHEVAHIVMAKRYSLKTSRINFKSFGQFIVIKDIERLDSYEKFMVYISGPLTNLILWGVFAIFFRDSFELFRLYNLAIGLFNLLPTIPFDGGRLFVLFFGSRIGVIKTNQLLVKISKLLSAVMLIVGIVQFRLHIYNISLICISIYIFRVIEKEKIFMASDFYKALMNKNSNLDRKALKIENIMVSSNTQISRVVNRLCLEKYFIINVIEQGNMKKMITEYELVNHVVTNGIRGKIKELMDS